MRRTDSIPSFRSTDIVEWIGEEKRRQRVDWRNRSAYDWAKESLRTTVENDKKTVIRNLDNSRSQALMKTGTRGRRLAVTKIEANEREKEFLCVSMHQVKVEMD